MFLPHQSVLRPAIAHHFSRDVKKNTEQKKGRKKKFKMVFLPELSQPKPGHIGI